LVWLLHCLIAHPVRKSVDFGEKEFAVFMQPIFKILILISGLFFLTAHAARIKDIATISGVRENQLVGYGLVVGLNGSGDTTNQAPFTDQSFKSMLREFGINLPNANVLQLKNVAAVAISADLPPFAKIGQRIDITVSSLGNAKSIRGGTLLMTPLRGADRQVYAVAQGSVIVSGIGAQGADGSSVTVNVPSNGRIPNGATVEKTIDMPFTQGNELTLNLNQADFTTAERVVDTINAMAGKSIAKAQDAGTVVVKIVKGISDGDYEKDSFSSPGSAAVTFISRLENLTLDPGEAAAKIVINSRTGTVVIGQNVNVSPAAVSHGNLSVIISEQPFVSQPNALSNGETVVAPASQITVNQQRSRAFVFAPGASLNDIVNAVNKIGAAPGDLVSILEALKTAGALQAELVVI
jgi:flagellar P-ring protein FlgI